MLRALILRCLLIATGLFLGVADASAARTILIFGDSLSAGYGIPQESAWPNLLARRLAEKRIDYNVVNASISGETTSGGRARLDEALTRYAPDIVIIALGSNDGLRGLPTATLRENLLAMTETTQKHRARVLIVGQRLPPNYGPYAEQFHRVFVEVAKTRNVAFVDFLLEGVALTPDLFQPDNLHPTAAAQPRLLENVWRGLEPLLKK